MNKINSLELFIKELPGWLGKVGAHPSCLDYLHIIKEKLLKLNEYEQAEEQGRTLPYGIGNIIYVFNITRKNEYFECEINRITTYKVVDKIKYELQLYVKEQDRYIDIDPNYYMYENSIFEA